MAENFFFLSERGNMGNQKCKAKNTQGPQSRVAGWALVPPIIFSLLVFFLCN
jgi:hypothetical protein